MVELLNDFSHCRELLLKRLREPAPARSQLLTGPRQVGKTTLLLEIAGQFGEAAIYAAGDEPDAALPGFWERCWAEAETREVDRRYREMQMELAHANRVAGVGPPGPALTWTRIRCTTHSPRGRSLELLPAAEKLSSWPAAL